MKKQAISFFALGLALLSTNCLAHGSRPTRLPDPKPVPKPEIYIPVTSTDPFAADYGKSGITGLDKTKVVNQIVAALKSSPLTPVQKVQHALSRLGYGPNPTAKGMGVAEFLRYKKDSKGATSIDGDATDRIIAEWVWVNMANANRPEPTAETQIRNFSVTLNSALGPIVVKPSTNLSEILAIRARIVNYLAEKNHPVSDSDTVRSASSSLVNNILYFEQQRKVARAILAKYPLGEVLEDFWFNHFNVASSNSGGQYLQLHDYREKIRSGLAGQFAALLSVTGHHPAMLLFLNNNVNRRPISAKVGINENYAREVMELHTIGEGPNLGTYVQADVTQAARILTGMTFIGQTATGPAMPSFCAACHDPGSKRVMNQTFSEGEAGQAAFFRFLASHPKTAKNIAFKLVNRFGIEANGTNTVAEAKRAALQNKLASAYSASQGNLMQVYATLFGAPEFWSAQAFESKVKQPMEWVVSAYRAAGVGSEIPLTQENVATAVSLISGMGQPLFTYVFPTGYKDLNTMWANTNGINLAVSKALQLAYQGQAVQIGFQPKAGALLKIAALEEYFRLRNRSTREKAFQTEYGMTSGRVCFNRSTHDGERMVCNFQTTWMQPEPMRTLASGYIQEVVLDFEGKRPSSAYSSSVLNSVIDQQPDKMGGLPQPVRSQLALLLASPHFLKR